MDIPVAVPIMEVNKSAEEYNLEQKRDALYRAEQDLASIILSAEDFFDSPSDKDAVLQQIQKNPEAIVASSAKPFMKKIARAMIEVASLTNEVDEASGAVSDQHLTPAQVKVQITKALADQRTILETMMEERMATDRARYEKMLQEQKTLFEHKLVYSDGKLASLSSKMDRLFENQLRMERDQKAFIESQLREERKRSDKILEFSALEAGVRPEQMDKYIEVFWKTPLR